MAYKGKISAGSRVEAELVVDDQSAGTALLALAFVDNDGGQGAQSATVAPGGGDSVLVLTNPHSTGMLRVVVDFNDNGDTGRLTVRVNGTVRSDEPIAGDTTWSYSLA